MIRTLSSKAVVSDEWLGTIFNRPVFRVVLGSRWNDRSQDLESSIRSLQEKPVFIFAKAGSEDAQAAAFFKSLGFRLIDTQVTFEKAVSPKWNYTSKCVVRWARPEDEEHVACLAKRNSTTSRFHLDSEISKETANRVKEEWARNYFRGRRGERMAIADIEKTPCGFLQLIHSRDGTLIIDLIATDERQRRKGVASDMIAFVENETSGFPRIRVGTQASNIGSILLYEKLGFKVASRAFVFHYHHLSGT